MNMNTFYRGGLAQRYERIDQDEVPESKHTVFIRGLPGQMKTDEVKDFFEDHIGPCSFDFVKVSQDQLKLFVAVRFETRDAAKECMYKYKDNEILGYPVEMTWFKDIRRYVSYQQSQGMRPPTTRGRGFYRGRVRPVQDRRMDYKDEDVKRKRTFSDERRSVSSRSRSNSSRTRSHSHRSSQERSHSIVSNTSQRSGRDISLRSRSRLSSHSPLRRDGSPTPSKRSPCSQRNGETNNKILASQWSSTTVPITSAPANFGPMSSTRVQHEEPTRKSPSVSPVPERKSRKSKREKRKRRRRSSYSTNSGSSVRGHSTDELSEGELRRKILKKRDKAMKNELEALKAMGKGEKPKVSEEKDQITSVTETVLQNTTLKFGLESTEDIPKRVIRETPPLNNPKKQNLVTLGSSRVAKITIDDFLTKRNLGMQKGDLGSSMIGVHTVYGQQGHHVSMKTMLDDDPDPVPASTSGSLRLSTYTRQLNVGSERERKLGKLSPEMFAKYTAKKKEFETAYKNDCETFAFVSKVLIEKDPALEDRLVLALSGALSDIEESFKQKTDQYIDQLLMFMAI